MKADELHYQSLSQLGQMIAKKQMSPVELAKVLLARLESLQPTLNSSITILHEESIAAARQAEKEIQGGNYRGPFHGIPVGLKDLYNTQGIRTTSGSAIFKDYVPDADCAIAERFKSAGAYCIAKLNMTEFAFDPTGDNFHYGPARNPWNPECLTGGSSSGSGAAVASGQCPIAMGSDTGGSVRIPAALCGVVGHKPTYGLISRYGVTPLAWSLDHVGPLTRTVEDTAMTLDVLAGHDPRDPTSSKRPVPNYRDALGSSIKGMRIGIPKEYIWDALDPDVESAVKIAIKEFESLGAIVDEVSIPHLRIAPFILGIVISAEATAYHAKLIRERGSEYGPMIRLRMEAGFFITGADYIRAQQARRMVNREFHQALSKVDILVTPTIPVTAPKYDETHYPEELYDRARGHVDLGSTSRPVREALTRFTRLFNISGIPTISIPCGLSSNNLPIGLQLAGRSFADATVLNAAYAYEQVTEWHKRRPPV
jgi:aspartyl-tRNA(Asn)/glutamyl-tRNA(Gln) amidotransferase subunit A